MTLSVCRGENQELKFRHTDPLLEQCHSGILTPFETE